MPVKMPFENPYGAPTQQANASPPSYLTDQDRFLTQFGMNQVKNDLQKRQDEFDDLEDQWKNEAIDDQGFLSGIAGLAGNSLNDDERKKFTVSYGVAQKSVLKKKFETEYNRIRKKAEDKAGSPAAVYNELVQLATQAGMAGLESLASAYSLNASIIRNQMIDQAEADANKGKTRSETALNKIERGLEDSWSSILLGD